MSLASWLSTLVAKNRRTDASGRPVPGGKLFGPYAVTNFIALGVVVAAVAYVNAEHKPQLPNASKALGKLRKGGDEGAGA